MILAAGWPSGCGPARLRPTSGGAEPAASKVSEVGRRLDALVGGLHDGGLFDGAVVVGERGRLLWEHGYGFAEAGSEVPFTPDTATDGASLAKTVAAGLVLLLESEGRLRLDDPAQRLLPELPYPEITLRHLLSHSSGLLTDYGYFDAFLAPDELRTTERLLAVVAAERPALAFPPGSAFEYNSFAFDLASLAAARTDGSTYDALLERRVFEPLGMRSSFARPGRLADFPGVRTRAYRRNDGRLEPHDVFDLEAFHGGSNLYVSARDLHRWNVSFWERPILTGAALTAALRPAEIGGLPSGLTLGSWYRDEAGSAFWYSGHLQGFHAEVFREPELRRSVVYVSNNTLEPWLQKALVRAITAVLDGRSPPVLEPPATDEIDAEEYAALAGEWRLPGAGAVTVEISGSGLAVVRGGVSYPTFQVDPRTFYVPGVDWMIGFARQPDGSVARIHVSTNVAELWGSRPESSGLSRRPA